MWQTAPMTGWPAKGSSAAVVKMLSRRSESRPGTDGYKNTVSEKLNSRAIICLVSCVGLYPIGSWITAN